MKERIQFDNQLKDFNQQILSLKSQIDSRVQEAVQFEREEANRNAQTVIESLRQASNDLQRLCEEKEYLMKENIKFKEMLGVYDKLPNHPLAKQKHNAQSSLTGTPRGQIKQGRQLQGDLITSPLRPPYNSGGLKSPRSLAMVDARSQPMMPVLSTKANRENVKPVDLIVQTGIHNQVPSQRSDQQQDLHMLIRDYKSDNQKFSQRVQELQQQISYQETQQPLQSQSSRQALQNVQTFSAQNRQSASAQPLVKSQSTVKVASPRVVRTGSYGRR